MAKRNQQSAALRGSAPQATASPTANPATATPAGGDRGSRAAATPGRRGTAGRLARQRRGRRQGAPWPWIVGLGGLALIVAIQVGVNLYREATLPGERFASQGNVHVSLGASTPPYNSNPPTSGWHTPDLVAWGGYTDSVPDQRLVHNMEDGGVVLWYRAGSEEENAAHVEALEAVVAGRYARVVIAPRQEMPTTYALTAWRRLQRFDAVDPEAMRTFVAAYHGLDHHPR